MRALISDITAIGAHGYAPQVDLETGIRRYIEWIANQGDVKDYFAAAERRLRRRKVVKRSTAGSAS